MSETTELVKIEPTEFRKPAKTEKPVPRKKTIEQLCGAMDLFASPKRQKLDELEVTGVSRSGRVRKKSSKLVDFESPDDITETKQKRQQKAQQIHAQQLLERFEQQQLQAQPAPIVEPSPAPVQNASPKKSSPALQRVKSEILSDDVQSSGSDSEEGNGLNEEENFSVDSASDDEIDPLMIDEGQTGFRRLEPPEQETPSQAQSLYMLEKCKKKLIIKDGKVIGKMKAQRKDKGRTRFTAYMLWAKEVRQDLLEKCPYMDFAAISKRLGELWATVPNIEKYNWRRRAKRLAAKPPSPGKEENIWKMPPPGSRKKFINRSGGNVEKPPKTRKTIQLGVPSMVGNLSISPPVKKDSSDSVGSGVYKVVGTQPIDVAAHLKLLGESLTIIGERLKEHEGQIAVSGTLSVLLDSLICALGPLLCLTQQVPGTDGANPETLSQMLDNIAYIMPGL